MLHANDNSSHRLKSYWSNAGQHSAVRTLTGSSPEAPVEELYEGRAFLVADVLGAGSGPGRNDAMVMVSGHVLSMTGARMSPPTEQLLTGSLSGTLRLYQLHGGAYTPQDVVLELALERPILQLAVGAFMG